MEESQKIMRNLLNARNSSVLSKNSILKAEHFPLSKTAVNNLPLQVHGAPNFRRTKDCNICGVAQPSISGLRAIHRLLCQNQDSIENFPVLMCIRDEPVIYLDGMPFVLRDAEEPLQNMRAFSGISADRVESLELRLKSDILQEMSKNDGLLVIHEEQGMFQSLILEKGNVQPFIISPKRTQTTRQVFEQLAEEGFSFIYFRIPISHEQSPTETFVDDLLNCFDRCVGNNTIIFSGGMGVGRTTFAMVAAYLYFDQQNLMNTPQSSSSNTNSTLQLIYNLEKGIS